MADGPARITRTMPLQQGAGFVVSLSRTVALVALGRSDLRALSLGTPHLWPAARANLPAGPLRDGLQPHTRRLWRRRALIVLSRFATIALAYLLPAELIARHALALPQSLVWAPALMCILAGIWLAFAQRPSSLDAARLLDRHFRLRDVLGTAVEISMEGGELPLHRRQLAAAVDTLQRVPPRPWAATARHQWYLPIALLLGLIAAIALSPQPAPGTASGASGHGAKGRSAAQRPFAVAQNTLATTGAPLAAVDQGHAGGTASAARARAATLALSLQVHTGPQSADSTGSESASYLAASALNGSAKGGKAARPTGSQGSSGAAGQHGKGNSGSGGQGGDSSSQDLGGVQSPQNGPQNDPNQAGNNQRNSASSANNGAQRQGAQPSTQDSGQNTNTSGPNPFGQDQKHPNPSSPTARGKRTSGGAGQRQRSSARAGGRQATAPGTAAPNQNSDQGPDVLRRGTQLGNQRTTGARSLPRAHSAGPAQGPQIAIGGHYVIGNGAQGAQLVRIMPEGVASGPGLQGSGPIGPTVVHGYVPENDTTLTPDEQALVRAYFSGDNGP